MDTLNVGVIGLGCRGTDLLGLLLDMEDITVAAVCDSYPDRAEAGADAVYARTGKRKPARCKDWEAVLSCPDVDAVFIFTSWRDHIKIAAEAMRRGKPVAMEVGGAYSLHDCWRLVETYEETGTPIMMLENCCFGQTEMMLSNMIRQDVFGEIVYCQGGYRHDLRREVAFGRENRHYRLDNYLYRNADNYPTHELGPIAKMLGVNRGNRMLSLFSTATKAAGLREYIASEPGAPEELAGKGFRQGDVVTTAIRCAGGEVISLVLDTTLPRPYSRGLTIQGTRGMFCEDNNSVFIDNEHNEYDFTWQKQWGNFEAYREKYEHPVWAQYLKEGVKKGHGGMDWLVLRSFIERLRNREPMEIDVYDTAAWMCVTALSEQSIATNLPVYVPDFTNGKWITSVLS